MKPKIGSKKLLGITRSKAKMFEYAVPIDQHIKLYQNPEDLFSLSIGILGELSVKINNGEVIDEEYQTQLKNNLQFSASFFDSYINAQLNKDLDSYLLLVGAAAYYLCELPGSSSVLIRKLDIELLELEAQGLETLLYWLLCGDFTKKITANKTSFFYEEIKLLSLGVQRFFINGDAQGFISNGLENLRNKAYEFATPRQLLFSDVICAIIRKKIENSTWRCLPIYSDIPVENWKSIIEKEHFLKELWPAQHLIGRNNVLKGESAVIQMPTSAGKTRATELIIRSSFLSNRTSLVIIIAPFRALCHEIRSNLLAAFINEDISVKELTDVIQVDFSVEAFLGRRQVLVVTPEKLLYSLRFSEKLAENLGLVIYDEGHQFDNGNRGVSYELLLSSLKELIPKNAQSVMISAVMKNAEDVSDWLNGEEAKVITGTSLLPTYRTIAFTSWTSSIGKLEFTNPSIAEDYNFYVPNIIEEHQLVKKGRERLSQKFPNKSIKKFRAISIASLLGLKLSKNGGVAIFCGKKNTASNVCEAISNAYNRNLGVPNPRTFSDEDEIDKLYQLYLINLGENNSITECAQLGVFTHHGNTPQGIRLAVEYALQQGLAKFVVCTSTLAQGVNLPIRYLIVTELVQGKEKIKVRDFHNLIGRAGRAGMHTEGSIIFADPLIYDERNRNPWRWNEAKSILEAENSEPCTSSLLNILNPISDDNTFNTTYYNIDITNFLTEYYEDSNYIDKIPDVIIREMPEARFNRNSIAYQLSIKLQVVNSIESYLMTYWDNSHKKDRDEALLTLVNNTLAFHLAKAEDQDKLIKVFQIIALNLEDKMPDPEKRKAFGRTLYGLNDTLQIEEWITLNWSNIIKCTDEIQLFYTLWPIIELKIQNKSFRNCSSKTLLPKVAEEWLMGKPYSYLYDILNSDTNIKIGKFKLKIDHVVDLCEGGFSYDSSLLLGAIQEVISFNFANSDINPILENLKYLQKRLKYGLPSAKSIYLFESGFADRVIAQDIASNLITEFSSKEEAEVQVQINQALIKSIVKSYPSYYETVLDRILM